MESWGRFVFYNNIFHLYFRWSFSDNRSKKRETNRPLPSSINLHFQNEAKCTTFLVKMSFICMRIKNHFHIKGWAPNLVLIQRPGGTRKWPITPPPRHFCSLLVLFSTIALVQSAHEKSLSYCKTIFRALGS